MKHVKAVSRTPALAEENPADLTSLIAVIQLVLQLLTAFTGGATTVITGIANALTGKNTAKNG